ncbi:YcxB family protein [Arcicella sp. DC2W]|uniref:YcxB family protein n=1 Tax=Arcicella gelida TaxID=2984195 RepID=A0ABU5S5Q8_9BACT|nr:YcxB family protein [Arcicella sp. DC2W]MEA5403792.1 YcxB family protein [Arcicella sp. DC2W]
MNFSLTYVPDRQYYEEAYREMISSLKLKKYEPVLATIMIVFGIGLYLLDKNNKLSIFPLVFCSLGIYEFYKVYHEKKKWLKDRLDSKVLNQPITLEFNEATIKHNSTFANGELKWDGLKDIVKTKNGILLKPENGLSIYLPDKIFRGREEIEFILSRKKGEN